MNSTEAILQIAQEFAEKLNYKRSSVLPESNIDTLYYEFNKMLTQSKNTEMLSIRYVPDDYMDEKYLNKRRPKIEIDIFWGNPRLTIDLKDGTMASIVYCDNELVQVQAFGIHGLKFLNEVKSHIDNLINN